VTSCGIPAGLRTLQATAQDRVQALQADTERYFEEVQQQMDREERAARGWPRSVVMQLAAMMQEVG
jgi:hypothetical protein